nr:hypothetical protein [Tanacetum cinerariifolium]
MIRLSCGIKSQDDELSDKELKHIEADDQAIQTILLGLPEHIYAGEEGQKEVDELKAERLAKTQDPLALMANSNNPYAFPAPHQDQSSFNQNYLQQPMPNPKDITDPTTAKNMALALMAKAFKLNYSSPTNNNQRISSNLRNRQIAQPGQNAGNPAGYNDVIRNQNRLGNGNLVVARAEGNAAWQNGNQIRCYNCRGVEQYDLMADVADLDEIEEVNANCILMANLQQASTSSTQTDSAPVYDTDGSAENDNDVISEDTSVEQGVVRFGKREKLNPRYVRPFKVLNKVGAIAYKLELPQELSRVHNTFHVSNLKKCYSDDQIVIPLVGLQVDDKLHFVEEPVEVMDLKVKQLRRSPVPIVKRICDSKETYVSFVHGENYAVDRRKLWKNLKEHNSTAGIFSWVIFGDHNVILNPNENSNGINVKNCGVQKRRDLSCGVLKKLDKIMGNGCFLEDFPTAFANFLPFGPSDHSPAILVLLDVMGRKKNSFRFSNYLANKEGFFDKGRVIRNRIDVIYNEEGKSIQDILFVNKLNHDTAAGMINDVSDVEIKNALYNTSCFRVQYALSKDPSNANLREEELLYADAFKKAMLDEELLLKQKSKIQWLKEGDFNNSYFHKMVKGRVIRNRIDVIYNEEGKSIQDILFVNKLNHDTAAGMINDVSDVEIKNALYNTSCFRLKSVMAWVPKEILFLFVQGNPQNNIDDKGYWNSGWSRHMTYLSEYEPYDGGYVSFGHRGGKITEMNEFCTKKGIRREFSNARTPQQNEVAERRNRTLIEAARTMLADAKLPVTFWAEAVNTARGLDEFCLAYGLHPSMTKSKEFFCNVSERVIQDINLVMSFKEGMLPIKYLGVPMIWPTESDDRFDDVISVHVPNLVLDISDKARG